MAGWTPVTQSHLAQNHRSRTVLSLLWIYKKEKGKRTGAEKPLTLVNGQQPWWRITLVGIRGDCPHCIPSTNARWLQVPLGLRLVTWISTVLQGLLPHTYPHTQPSVLTWNVRHEADKGGMFQRARKRALGVNITHFIAALRAAPCSSSREHTSPRAQLCSMFSGNTWWNRVKTAQRLGVSCCVC